MKKTIKREAKRVSTWGLILTGLAAVGECIPALAQIIPGPVVPILTVVTIILKAYQKPAKEER